MVDVLADPRRWFREIERFILQGKFLGQIEQCFGRQAQAKKTQNRNGNPFKMKMNTEEKSKRDCASDAVRSLACLLVMAHHAFQSFPPSSSKIATMVSRFFVAGNAGVAVFFVLSGALLSTPFWKNWFDGKEMPSLKIFYIRRLSRIAPAFWLNIIVCYLVSAYLLSLTPQFGLMRLLAGITFISGFSFLTLFPTDINGPLWSISFEIVSYGLLSLGALMLFKKRGDRTLKSALKFWGGFGFFVAVVHILFLIFLRPSAATVYPNSSVITAAKNFWPEYNPVGFFLFFLLGILTSGVSESAKRTRAISANASGYIPDLIVTLGAFIVALLLLGMHEFSSPYFSIPPLPYLFPVFPLFFSLFLVFVPYSVVWKKVFENKAFYYLSTLSYGLYLWHNLFLTLVPRLPMVSKITNMYLTWIVVTGISYFAALVVAAVSWKYFEKPILSLAHKFK
ncbi:MAG: acyltransferase [Fibrobacterota bacterium]|nr:MAG: acyltransferase [Fibrobacterota bacterium]